MSLAPTAAEQDELLTSIGDFQDGTLEAALPDIWTRYVPYGGRLQFLYVKKDLIDLAMGEVRKRVNFQTPQDVSVEASQLLNNLLKMRQAVERDIAKLEAAGAGAVVETTGGQLMAFTGEMLRTGSSSVTGHSGGVDANSSVYRGSPYRTYPKRIP